MRLSKYNSLAAIVVLSFVSASAWGATLSGASFFRADSNGNNINGQNGILHRGGWTTVLGQENVPGNLVYNFWLSQTAIPSFITPAASVSVPLAEGANTFYFWADNDDTLGGANTFGLNLFFNSAEATSPSISSYVIPGVGETAQANFSPNTPGLNMAYVPGTGTLSFINGNQLIALSSFVVTALGGSSPGPGSVDLVDPFGPAASPNGITDTYGQFVITVTTIPEPSSVALLTLGGLAVLVRRRKQAV